MISNLYGKRDSGMKHQFINQSKLSMNGSMEQMEKSVNFTQFQAVEFNTSHHRDLKKESISQSPTYIIAQQLRELKKQNFTLKNSRSQAFLSKKLGVVGEAPFRDKIRSRYQEEKQEQLLSEVRKIDTEVIQNYFEQMNKQVSRIPEFPTRFTYQPILKYGPQYIHSQQKFRKNELLRKSQQLIPKSNNFLFASNKNGSILPQLQENEYKNITPQKSPLKPKYSQKLNLVKFNKPLFQTQKCSTPHTHTESPENLNKLQIYARNQHTPQRGVNIKDIKFSFDKQQRTNEESQEFVRADVKIPEPVPTSPTSNNAFNTYFFESTLDHQPQITNEESIDQSKINNIPSHKLPTEQVPSHGYLSARQREKIRTARRNISCKSSDPALDTPGGQRITIFRKNGDNIKSGEFIQGGSCDKLEPAQKIMRDYRSKQERNIYQKNMAIISKNNQKQNLTLLEFLRKYDDRTKKKFNSVMNKVQLQSIQ